jgi:glycosyltransferase involved in cell wall biosynthesis
LLSIVIPIQNEANNPMFPKLLSCLRQLDGVEVLFVDGDSRDGTEKMIRSAHFQYMTIGKSNRAQRLNVATASDPVAIRAWSS